MAPKFLPVAGDLPVSNVDSHYQQELARERSMSPFAHNSTRNGPKQGTLCVTATQQ